MILLVFLLVWVLMIDFSSGLYLVFWMVLRISEGLVVVFCGVKVFIVWKLLVLVMMVVYCFNWLSWFMESFVVKENEGDNGIVCIGVVLFVG